MDEESKDVASGGAQQYFGRYIFITFVFCIVLALSLAYEIYFPHVSGNSPREVVIAPGMGSRMIGALLKERGVIRSRWAFVTYVSLRGEASSLKPGQYVFSDSAAIPEIARDLIAGTNREKIIFIPEGWNTRDIARYFEVRGIAQEQAALDFFDNPPRDFAFAERARGTGMEGYLFPDTYRIFQDSSLTDIARKMLDNFDRKFAPDMRMAISRQEKNVRDIIIMASLIEKEVAGDRDRAIVSGVLWKRIAFGIPLQVDATVRYAKIQSSKSNVQNAKLSLQDTKINSPYNTYRYRGLPPGPIANPGLSSIRAAIFPASSPYLYYLSSSDGRTIFSRTLEEHNAAKAKYLRGGL